MKLEIPKEELDQLKQIHKSLKDKKAAYRVHTIILLGSGYSYEQVSEILLMSERNARRFFKKYMEGGTEALLKDFYKGGISKLSSDQESQLCAYLDDHLIGSAKEVCAYVKEQFGIDYTPDGMVITLHRLGYSYKKTKLQSEKADPKKQQEWVNTYNDLTQNLEENEKIYFMDGVHPTYNVQPAYAWTQKGEERTMDCNTGRQRININGVYSPDDHEIIMIESDRINAQSTIELFKKIESQHPELDRIYIVRDNARYYCAKLVQEYLTTSRITVIPLPSYSPNLNLIERLWKFFKKKVVANKYYGTFDEFKDAVRNFFAKIMSFREDLSTLLTEKFHIVQSTN